MTTTPRTDYMQSPFHQGSRSRTGSQVDRQFVHDLLAVLGDCRLLWLPNLTDTTTSTERSRHAATITWSESLASFDTGRARLGSGVAVHFNGTDEEGDVPDDDRYSFGDGASDQPFSIVVLANPDVVNAQMMLVSKYDTNNGAGQKREYRLYMSSGGLPVIELYDEDANAQIGRSDATALTAATWVLLAATYDGSGAEPGIRLYKDAARVDDSASSSGTYVSMTNQATPFNIAMRRNVGGGTDPLNLFDGKIALVAVTAKQLTSAEVWAVKELANAYFGLSL